MKLKHWVGIAFVLVGALYVLHIVTHHGGLAGFKSGLGFGR